MKNKTQKKKESETQKTTTTICKKKKEKRNEMQKKKLSAWPMAANINFVSILLTVKSTRSIIYLYARVLYNRFYF